MTQRKFPAVSLRGGKLRLAMPSGVFTAGVEVRHGNAGEAGHARGSLHRTARRRFDGYLYA